MEQEVIKNASSKGVWALLIVVLLFYVLKTNEKRENKLQLIIDKLAGKLGIVEKMQNDIHPMVHMYCSRGPWVSLN